MSKQLLRIYGRRKGRKLSTTNKNIINSKSTNFVIKPNLFENDFSVAKSVNFLEIGFGDGENILRLAKKFPNFYFYGAEPYVNSYVKVS